MLFKKQQKMDTVIGAETYINGEINSNNSLRVDGTIEGTIKADWITIGDSGKITGNIICRGIIVGGNVNGTINASEIITITQKGSVTGEIFTVKISIEEGGKFEGKSCIQLSNLFSEGK
ncbi:polymer-forming cytoskeletal protein [Thermodesulfovibrio sp.]|jgi:cytoskeletal protein CcmA (bactofilin family)|uniref:bactofilin family protein n=1 Tax=Thermodesulfovibrio TaxID=28261 RepID=UPI00260FED75|nr:polymer-forming cytoskeletal protein [Thermodesulfovibrio sp.]